MRIRATADDLVAAELGLVTLAAARDGGVPARAEYVSDAAKAWASARSTPMVHDRAKSG